MTATLPKLEKHREPSDLIRGLRLWPAIAIVIGDTIGTGIFLVSSDMARATGSALLVFAAWFAGGLICLFGAFCFAELGAAFPEAGGPYVYLNRGLGRLWGFLFGWMTSFLQMPVGMATLAAGFLRFIGFLFPIVATPLFTGHIGSYSFVFTSAQPLAALVIVVAVGVNYLSVRMGGAIQVLLTSLKIGTIVLIVIVGLLFGKVHATHAGPTVTLGMGTFRAFLTALVPAMWAYYGFNELGYLGAEIVSPQKNIPRAILLGLVTVAGLYILANIFYFHTLSFSHIAQSQHVASDAVQTFAGSRGTAALTLAMAISAFGALHVMILAGARIPYAMAADGVFFQFAKRLHPRFRSPSGALFLVGSLALLLALTGTFEELYSLFVFAVWIFFALTAISLFYLRKKEPDVMRPYRAWGYPWSVLVFLVAALALTVNLWTVRPVRSSLGLAVMLAGIPFFYRWRKAPSASAPKDAAGLSRG